MDQKLHEHYLQLWQLTESLRKDWWEPQERETILQVLKDVVVRDAILSELNPQALDFPEQLSLKLQSLILGQPEIPQANLPPAEVFKVYEEHLQHLDEKKQENQPTIIFRRQKRPLAISEKIYEVLRHKNLVDGKGNTLLENANPKLIAEAEEEIGQLVTQSHRQAELEQQIASSLEGKVPLRMLRQEFFGQGEIPGIIKQISQEFTTAQLQNKPYDLRRVPHIIRTYLENSAGFQLLDFPLKERILTATTQTTLQEIPRFKVPKTTDRVVISQKGKDIALNIISTEGESFSTTSISVHPRNIAERVQREIGLETTVSSTENLTRFVASFSKDPVRASFEYPYYSFINLLPSPLKKWYWEKKKMEKKWQEWYAISVSSDVQRQYLENLGKTAAKAFLSIFGVYQRDEKGKYHFILSSAVGWLGEKAVTGIGEGFAKLSSKIPFVGRFLSKTFRRRLGKDRNRDESLATNLVGLLLDFGFGILGLTPKLAWKLLNRIPAVREFKTWLRISWKRFYANLDMNPVLKYLRIGKGILSGTLRALPHGLASGGLGYLVTGGNPWGAIGFGSADFFFHSLKNWGAIRGIETTGFGQIFSSRFIQLPIKGPLFTWLLTDTVLPAFGINLPFGLKLFGSILSGGLEYGYLAGLRPWMAARIPAGVAKYLTGPLGKFFGFLGKLINPGAFLGGSAAFLAGLNPLQIILAGAGSGLAYLGLLKLLFGFTSPFLLTGWLGYLGGGLLANVLGLTGWYALGLQAFTTALSLWLTHIGVQAIASWVASSVAAGLNAALAGTAATAAGLSAATIGAFIAAIVAVVVIFGYQIFVIGSAFQEKKAISRALLNPRLRIEKSVSVEKIADEIKALNYNILITYLPQTTDPPGDLKIDKIIDEPEDPVKLSYFDNLSPLLADRSPSSFSCDPTGIGRSKLGLPDEKTLAWEDLSRFCPNLSSISPGVTKLLTMHLVFNKTWQTTSALQGKNICNNVTVWATTPDGKPLDPPSSSPVLCVTPEGKVVNVMAADLAKRIVQTLRENCSITQVDSSTISDTETCLRNYLTPFLPSGAVIEKIIEEIKTSVTNNEGKLQCIGFVMAIEAATGGTFDQIHKDVAKDYWQVLPGYQQITADNLANIIVGDILIWTNGETGHAAITTDIYRDSSNNLVKIVIAEAIGADGTIRLREIPVTSGGIDSPGLAGWQRRK